MVSKATNMVLGSGTKNVLAIKLKILMEKQYSHKTWAFFYEDKLNFGVISIDCWFTHCSILFCYLENIATPVANFCFLEWMCFLQYVICFDRKCDVYIFIMDRTSNIQNISDNVFWSKMRCVHLHNGASFSACIFSNISLVQVF